ncbi:MAG: 8-oxo-dGTP diphosphatase [bacterium]
MKIKDYKKNCNDNLRKCSLVFLRDGEKILLAMKKKGFGEGKYNGVGGKQEEGESIEQTAIRETQEELSVTPKDLKHMGILNFYFPHKSEWDQQVWVYFVDIWDGEPIESEEMAPKWFHVDEIPFDCMWSDDIHWLPRALKDQRIESEFMFDKDNNILDMIL